MRSRCFLYSGDNIDQSCLEANLAWIKLPSLSGNSKKDLNILICFIYMNIYDGSIAIKRRHKKKR